MRRARSESLRNMVRHVSLHPPGFQGLCLSTVSQGLREPKLTEPELLLWGQERRNQELGGLGGTLV